MYDVTGTEIESDSSYSPHQFWFREAALVVGVIAVVKLALHLYSGPQYGYFVDELYYLACARHLDSGYVDQPPLIAVIARMERGWLRAF